jgi:hypothetical protein
MVLRNLGCTHTHTQSCDPCYPLTIVPDEEGTVLYFVLGRHIRFKSSADGTA